MARANLGELLGSIGADEYDPEVAQAGAPGRDALTVSSRSERPEPGAGAPYLQLVRKETRLREDQLSELTRHARRLTRARTTAGQRITENSLIRIGVDLLLARIDRAVGDDEAAIAESLNR